jgi:toxin ParE1/3/4
MNYELSRLAQTDLEEIWNYTAKNWSVNQANKYYETIFQEIERICQNSDIGKSIRTIKELHRIHPVKSHIIIYKLEKQSVWIDRILHKRMNIETRIGK